LIDAALRIQAKHRPPIEDIVSVEALVPHAAIDAVCEPIETKRRPTEAYAAEFSAFYVIAATLIRGKFDLDDLQPDALKDPRVLALAQQISYAVDPHSDFPKHYTGALKVRMRNGEVLEAREDVDRGSPERPLSDSEIVAKFEANAGRIFRRSHVERLRDMILDIDRLPDVGLLMEQLAMSDSVSCETV
jgi:2-methylcitrate dehydratase PrpD